MVAAVFGVSEKIEDKYLSSVVVDGGDEAEVVTAHIEDGDDLPALHFHLVGVGKHAAGFDGTLPRAGKHQSGPVVQRTIGLGEPGSVVAQGASFNQPHREDNMSSSWPVCQTAEILALISCRGVRVIQPLACWGRSATGRFTVLQETGGRGGVRTWI